MTEDEYEFDDLSRADAASILSRLADGVAGGSVTVGEETIAVPERLDVDIEHELGDEERELEVELEWPLSGEDAVDAGGADDDAASVEDSAAEAASAQEPDTADEGVAEDSAAASGHAEAGPSPSSVVEPGAAAETGSKATFELFEDSAGEWRWRLVHDNGNIIADSGEGYSSKAKAKQGLRSVQTNAASAAVTEA